jgi:hypothetical protein
MAIGRISGPLLKNNLLRDGVDLAFETDLLYLKVSPQVQGYPSGEDGDPNYPLGNMGPARGIGINTNNPLYDLHIVGTAYADLFIGLAAHIGDVDISTNVIASSNGNLYLNPATSNDRVVIGPAEIPEVYGDTNFNSAVSVEGSLEVNDQTIFNSDVTINADSTVLGDSNIVGDLNVGLTATYTSITASVSGVTVLTTPSLNLLSGTSVRFSTVTGVTGLNTATTYFVYNNNSVNKTFQLASTKQNALNSTPLTTAVGTFSGSGTATIGGQTRFFNSIVVDQDLIVSGNLTFSNTENFVTLNDTQTLTNKTLTSPFINDGTVNLDGGNLILPLSTTPSQTQNGAVVWDSDTFLLTIGTGSSRKTLVDTDSTQVLSNKSFVNLNITGTTDSSSTTTGVLTVAGGVGIAKKLYVGTDVNVGNNLTVSNEAQVGVRLKLSTNAAIEYNAANDSIDFIFY